jgi:hypothetical protein
VTQAVQEVEELLRSHRLGEAQLATRAGLPDGGEHLAPKYRHHHPCRQQKPMAYGHPLPHWGQPTSGNQAVHVRVQDQRLTPGVQGRNDAGLGIEILWVRQQGDQGSPHSLKQQGRHHLDIGQPQGGEIMRHGEDHMRMVTRQEPRSLQRPPALGLEIRTLRT